MSAIGGTHGRLWGLWEMLEFQAHDFYRVISVLNRMQGVLDMEKIKPDVERQALEPPTADVKDGLSAMLDELRQSLVVLDASITIMARDRMASALRADGLTFDGLYQMVEDLINRLRDELSLRKVLVLSPTHNKYFESGIALFGSEVAQKFRSEAAFEIDEAAKCLALGRPTAAVFHLMRTMEIGIRAVSRCLGIPDPVKPRERNWGAILGAVNDGCKIKWPNAADRMSGDGAFFEGIHASLDAVKNPWRNATMHVENKYTDDEAEHIFSAVKGFMMNLASRMDEDGNPKA